MRKGSFESVMTERLHIDVKHVCKKKTSNGKGAYSISTPFFSQWSEPMSHILFLMALGSQTYI